MTTSREEVLTALTVLEKAVLRALDPHYYTYLRTTSELTHIPPEVCRAILRGLVDQGMAEYGRGLFSDDGQVAGSGYRLTSKGKNHADS